jgi:hypothetical protein
VFACARPFVRYPQEVIVTSNCVWILLSHIPRTLGRLTRSISHEDASPELYYLHDVVLRRNLSFDMHVPFAHLAN